MESKLRTRNRISSIKLKTFAAIACHTHSLARILRLQILPQATNLRKTEEAPKVAIYRNRKVATFHALPHIVPCVISMTLLILNIQGYFIGNVSVATLTAIQFAAKSLEVLIQSSLATIALSIVRHSLIGSEALSFGGLLAPFHTTHVSYLWSLGLWGSLTSNGFRRWRLTCIVSTFPFFIVLAAVVGPSGSVLMIPRLINSQGPSWLALLNDANSLFPSRMDLVKGQLL